MTLLALLPCGFQTLRASETEGAVLLLGPSFDRPPIYRFLPGSKRTLLYPARRGKGTDAVPFAGKLSPAEWDLFVKTARERSSLLLSTLNPTMVRDSHGVIQMAVIVSEDPLATSCILTPGFLQRFSAIFGPELLVAVPARNRIYVFPKLANSLPSAIGSMRDDYLISPMPLSTEIFELSRFGLRTIGSFDPDAG
jgi:hypothetical protein